MLSAKVVCLRGRRKTFITSLYQGLVCSVSFFCVSLLQLSHFNVCSRVALDRETLKDITYCCFQFTINKEKAGPFQLFTLSDKAFCFSPELLMQSI